MSKSDKKLARRLAAAEEQRRRQAEAAESSPLTRDQIDQLWLEVATEIDRHGHQDDFSITIRFLDSIDAETDTCLEFFRAHRMETDFDVLTDGDPNLLFGESDGRVRRMPLSRAQLEEMLCEVDSKLKQTGCDHTTSLSAEWLESQGHPVTATLMACLAMSCGCDCEIVLNIRPDSIYT